MFKRGKKTKEKSSTEIRLVNSGDGVHKNEVVGEMPPPDELHKAFEALISELGFDAKKTEMLAWPDDRKWMLLSQHQDKTKDEESKKKGGKLDTPQYHVGVLKSANPSSNALRALRVSLSNQGVSWIAEFLDLGGLDLLMQSLEHFDYRHKTEESIAIQAECIYAIKALMNTHAGLKAVISTSRVTNQLALSLVSDNIELKCVVFSLLAALCLVPPHGHQLMIEGMDYVRATMREKQRFAHVLQGMKDVGTHHLRDDYYVACMRFVNSFVNTPPELEHRIRLRSEFINQSLDVYIEDIKGYAPEVDNQVNIFNDMMEEDHKELDEQFVDVNIRDPVEIASKIDASMTGQSQRTFFINVMRLLYQLSRQEGMAAHLWAITDDVISQVVHRRYLPGGLAEEADGAKSADNVGKRFKETLATTARLEELNDEVKRLRVQLGIGRSAGSKLNIREDIAGDASPRETSRDDSKRQKELEDRIVKLTQERMQFEEQARSTEKRAEQLETALDNYRSQLEQTEKKYENLEAEHAHLKANPPAPAPAPMPAVTAKERSMTLRGDDGEPILFAPPLPPVAEEKPVEEYPEYIELSHKFATSQHELQQKDAERQHAIAEFQRLLKEKEDQLAHVSQQYAQALAQAQAAPAPAASAPPPPPPAPPAPPATPAATEEPAPAAIGAPPPPPPPAPKAPGPPPPPPGPSKGGPPPPPTGKPVPNLPAQPAKTGPVPKVKMVQYNWKKLANAVADGQVTTGFWANAADRVGDLKSEFGTLEDLFGAKKTASNTPTLKLDPSGGPMSPTAADDKPKAHAHAAVTLLDFKRVQALSILLSRMKLSNDEVRAAILSLDTNKITPDDLKALCKNAPTLDEIEMLRSYPDDPSTLGKPEQFCLAIMDIPRLQTKLESFLFTQKFTSQVEELKPDIVTLAQACTQLKGSKKFAKVLELVLALGNFVNGGTFRGGFSGFKLDSLLALQDVRSPSDPKMSLLHYFARLLREKYPDLLNFASELSALEGAKRISLQTIASEMGTLRKELRAATQEAEASKADGKGSVAKVLSASLATITPQFEALDAEFAAAQKAFTEVVAFFAEDSRTSTPEEFFSIVTKFSAQLEAVHKEAASEKERIEREAKRQAQAAQRLAEKQAKQQEGVLTPPPLRPPTSIASAPLSPQLDSAPGATNIMDNLISDLSGDTVKDTIKGARAKRGGTIGGPPNPFVTPDALNVVLRKTGGPANAAPRT